MVYNNNLSNSILDEQHFPYENMKLEERNSYLNILKYCKDIYDSKYAVNGERRGTLVDMRLKKKNNQILFNGSLNIGNTENRCIEGYMFFEASSIIVDMHITRLSKDGAFSEYTVLDEFSIKNGKLIRSSCYNYDMQKNTEEIDDIAMKGMIK